jgi:muramoyltetrapeptide carboxypeptidase
VTIKPQRLEPGDTIGIIAPAGPVDRNEIKPAIELLKERGYHALASPNLYKKKGYLAGSDKARLDDLQYMFSDNSVKAILCARGGYGTIRLLDRIDYDVIRKNPKIIAGYSDITTLLFAIFKNTGLVTFHGPVLRDLVRGRKNSLDNLLALLTSKTPQEIDLSGGAVIKQGHARGTVIGGNLSLICSLAGTPFMPRTKGAILFIEDKGEPLYRVDRMLSHLRLAGVINDLSGLISGSFTECGDIKDIKKILKDITSGTDIPVITGLPVGHDRENKAIPMGIQAELDTGDMNLSFLETHLTWKRNARF